MPIRKQIETLAREQNTPCVRISLNTHRTHPDNAQDKILLKTLIHEAEEKVIAEFGKRPVAALLEKLATIESEVNANYNLDSLHIYVSNQTKEIIKSAWPTNENAVHISTAFNLRSLIQLYNRNEAYFILLLSQNGVTLYHAINQGISNEIKNKDFPFPENSYFNAHAAKISDSKQLDDLVREFLNRVDKAVVKMNIETGLNCVVICTEDNHSRLMQVADKPSVYIGHARIDYHKTDLHFIALQGWEIIKTLQQKRRTDAIVELKEGVGEGNVFTDLQEIYQRSLDGQGDLFMVHTDYVQPVIMKSDRTFELTTDTTQAHAIDDIASQIAWNVLSKNGRVFFTTEAEIQDLGEMALKVRN
jgi:hypothetical protein